MTRIAELRKKAGLTQVELAAAVGTDPSTVRNWERSRGGLEAIQRVIRLCQALQCSPEDLLDSGELES